MATTIQHTPSVQGGGANPFVPISSRWRLLLVLYLCVYHWANPLVSEILTGSPTPLAGLRLLTQVIYSILLFAPLVFGGGRFGWLHPFILPPLFTAAKSLMKQPERLIAPLTWGGGPRELRLYNPKLPGYSEEVLAWAELQLGALSIVSLIMYYTGYFFLPRPAIPKRFLDRVTIRPGRRMLTVLLFVIGGSILGAIAYLYLRGGLSAHLLSYWSGGRGDASATLRGEVGVASVLVDVGLVGLLVWYAADRTVLRSPVFIASLLAILSLDFLLTGSRGGLFLNLVLVVLVWILHYRKLPNTRLIVIGLVGLVAIGRLGEFRQSITHDATIDWSTLTSWGIEEDIAAAREEIDLRQSTQGGVPIMIRVPDEVDYLYGESYLHAVFFWLPRIVWPDKPRGIGYFNTSRILNAGDYGTPVPAVAEAYWNFGVPGVVAVFLLFGVFHCWLAAVFARHGRNLAIWVPYLLAMFFIVPGTSSIVFGIRTILVAAGILYLIRVPSSRASRGLTERTLT